MNYYQQIPGGQYAPPMQSPTGQTAQQPPYGAGPLPGQHMPPPPTHGGPATHAAHPGPPNAYGSAQPGASGSAPNVPGNPASDLLTNKSAAPGYDGSNQYSKNATSGFVDQPLNDVPLQNVPMSPQSAVSPESAPSPAQPGPVASQSYYASQPQQQRHPSVQAHFSSQQHQQQQHQQQQHQQQQHQQQQHQQTQQQPRQQQQQTFSPTQEESQPQSNIYASNAIAGDLSQNLSNLSLGSPSGLAQHQMQPVQQPPFSSHSQFPSQSQQPANFQTPQSGPPNPSLEYTAQSSDINKSAAASYLNKSRYPQPNYGMNSPPQMMPQQTGQMPPMLPNQPQMQQHMGHDNYGQQLPPNPNYGQLPPPQPGQYGYNASTAPGAPGVPHAYGAQHLAQQPMHQQPRTQQSIDPDSIPNVIEVHEEDRNRFANEPQGFVSGIPCSVPPLHTTLRDVLDQRYLTHDAGSARPQFLRSSLYRIPISEDFLRSTGIPLNVIVQPFDHGEIDLAPDNQLPEITVPVSDSEIARCNRCKAYMSPFMRFTDGGKRFQCAMCHHITEVSDTYFAHLDHTGQRLDKYQRPELHLGSYEFRATAEFYRNSLPIPRRPHIIFAFELTQSSRHLIDQLSKHLAEVIRSSLPVDHANPQLVPPLVGFIGYNSKIHLFDIQNGSFAHVICDVAATFPPFTSFLVDPVHQMDKIEQFLDNLPQLYAEYELETESILGPVIDAALQTCQADTSNWFGGQPPAKDADKVIPVGKIYLFHCTLPTYGQDGVTPGRLKPRWTSTDGEVRRLLGSEKEKQILTPEPSKYYSKLGQRCVSDYGSGVELFLFPPLNGSYVDVATISELCRLTGTGGLHKFYNDHSTKFLRDLRFSLKATMAFDVVLKVRSSAGLRPVEYVGHFYSRNVSDIECAALNAGCNISVEFKYDDKLQEDDFVFVQAVALYTSVGGDRRVRVHNLALPVCSKYADIYKYSSCDAIINHLLRTSVTQLRMGEKTVQQVKEALINRSVLILTTYRKHCAQPGSTIGQLVLPETLKLLPVYLTGMIKVDAIDGGPEMIPDDKAYAQIRTLGANVDLSHTIVYPKMMAFRYNNEKNLEFIPQRCASYRLNDPDHVAYLLENGFYMFMYLPILPDMTDQAHFITRVFGVQTVQQIEPEKDLPLLDNPDSKLVNKVIEDIQIINRKSLKLYVIRQNLDKNEVIFKCFLYEDKKPVFGTSSVGDSKFEGPSYVDLLCHLHKEIRAQLN